MRRHAIAGVLTVAVAVAGLPANAADDLVITLARTLPDPTVRISWMDHPLALDYRVLRRDRPDDVAGSGLLLGVTSLTDFDDAPPPSTQYYRVEIELLPPPAGADRSRPRGEDHDRDPVSR